MNQTALIETIKQLITIESTEHNPAGLHAAYDYIRQIILNSDRPITIEEFESGGKLSLLAYRAGQRPNKFHIILNGHVDVVPGSPEQYQPYIKDDKLYGRGAYDMKAAVVVLTDVFCEFVDKVPYPLGLQITTDEEQAGRYGTQYQISQGVRADFVICGESGRSTTVNEIANEAKGIAVAVLEFKGSSAHGAYPWKGENAAIKAAHFVTRLHERYPTPPEATGETTITVTSIISASDAYTKIPDLATAKLDARYVAGDPNFQSKEHFSALVKEIDPQAEIVDFLDFSAPLYTNPQNPILMRLKASAERIEGKSFSFVRRNATSDGRYYGAIGNEACEFGITGEHQHGDGEYVPVRAIIDYDTTMRDFLTKTIQAEQPSQAAAEQQLTA